MTAPAAPPPAVRRAALPCPFCGGTNIWIMPPTCTRETPYNPADRAYPIARCHGCNAETAGDNWDALGMSALLAWNRRTPITGDDDGH